MSHQMNIKRIPKDVIYPTKITFDLYSADEIRKMSVVQVITPFAMNAAGHALPGGLYDPLMGPHDKQGICGTCQKNLSYCSGHFGHIELALPVINPLFGKTVLQLFRLSCVNCQAIVMPGHIKYLSIAQLKLLEYGLVSEAQQAEHILAELTKEQPQSDEKEKKKRTKKKLTAADSEYCRRKFQQFIEDHLGLEKPEFVESSRILESFRQFVLRRLMLHAKMSHKCQFCGVNTRKMSQFESKIIYAVGGQAKGKKKKTNTNEEEEEEPEEEEDEDIAPTQKYLTPIEARNHLRAVWAKEKDLIQHIFPVLMTTKSDYPTDVFFIEVLPVTPAKNRPSQFVNGMHVEHPVNLALRHVVESSALVRYCSSAINKGITSLSEDQIRALGGLVGDSLHAKLESAWNSLQADVDHVMDKDRNQDSIQNSTQMIGLKQIIEKKEGLFRMNMMGKRVNYAARTVITPDPNINIDEIGIPDVFAKVLTYPSVVNTTNVSRLRELILNGPDVYPGACAVKNERGVITRLDPNNRAQREGFANGLLVSDKVTKSDFTGTKTVYRHLQNGDFLLLNRQPSLHRPSIMAHKARVLHGEKVFRLHYANCKHYNADFDGDEMNAHFPQDEGARAEAASLVNVTNHFLVPKDGTPLGGLIQDHIVAAVKMTIRGRFFDEEDYHQLVFFALSSHNIAYKLEPPTILKPYRLWSGKQVVSTIIRNLVPEGKYPLSFVSTAKIKHEEWRTFGAVAFKAGGKLQDSDMSESCVIFREGRLLSGVLDKMHLGATPYGLCHSFYELYGHAAVGALLSAFSKLLTSFLQWEGFTLGVKDVLVMPMADEERQQFIETGSQVGLRAAANGVGLAIDATEEEIKAKLEAVHRSQDPQARAVVDQAYKQMLQKFTNSINSSILPFGLVSIFPENNLQLLVQSGAKGSTVNTMQMSCLLGQIELEGKRPPLTLSGKSLPSFQPYEVSPRAGGFIFGRFLTGIRPQEFFFHCMAGREGLIDTAVKTSRSGYLQRCLVKLLEGLVTHYDMTVRDSDGSIVQFLYGEDGLDVCRSQYLQSKQMQFLQANVECLKKGEDKQEKKKNSNRLQMDSETIQEVNEIKASIKEWKEDNLDKQEMISSTTKVRESGFLRFCKKKSKKLKDLTGLNSKTGRLTKAEILQEQWFALTPAERRSYSKKGRRCPDPVTSKYLPSTYGVISENLQKTIEEFSQEESFQGIVCAKAMEALSSPGDAVGVLAAQSIGEPSTQMTLNTFHFAGRGEMNVTLGIPRLREILMVASENIKTPSMDIPFREGATDEQCEAVRVELTRVNMHQVLEKIRVVEKLDSNGNRLYILNFGFLPFSEFQDIFAVTPATILKYFERSFIRNKLLPAIRKAMKLKKSASLLHTEREVNSDGTSKARGGDDDEEDFNGDDEAPKKNKSKGKDNKTIPENELVDLYDEGEKRGQGEEHESSDEEPDPEDADVTEARRAARQTEREYDEPEEEELLPEGDDDEDDGVTPNSEKSKAQRNKNDNNLDEEDSDDEGRKSRQGENEEEGDLGNEEDVEGSGAKRTKFLSEQEEIDLMYAQIQNDSFSVTENNYDQRCGKARNIDTLVKDYEFDMDNQEWCELTLRVPPHMDKVNMGLLLKDVAEKSTIHQVPQIKRAFIIRGKGQVTLKTEGINILAMAKYREVLNLQKLHCNNIHTMAATYGIEAALKVLIKEMYEVFKVYGITIDPRHLSLIADYMTNSGVYRPFNRIGISSSTSPLHQMSFETVVHFLRDATLSGKRDDLQNPSSRLVVGQNVKVGTEVAGCEPTLQKDSRAYEKQRRKRLEADGSGPVIYRPFAPVSIYKSRRSKVVPMETEAY